MVGSCTFFQVISFTFIHVFTNWKISRSFEGAKGYNLKLPAPTSQNCHKTYDLLRLVRSNKDPHQAMQAIVINYSKKKNRTDGDWGHTFLKTPLEFLIFFYPWKFQTKQSSTPGKSTKLCYMSLKFQGQKPKPLELPHYFFLVTPGNSTSFLINN